MAPAVAVVTSLMNCRLFRLDIRASLCPASGGLLIELRNLHELRQVAAENGDLVRIAQPRRVQDVIDPSGWPRRRMVGTHHDLTRAELLTRSISSSGLKTSESHISCSLK